MGRTPHEVLRLREAEIIQLVEESALPVRRTLEKIGIPRATFYRWYDLYQAGGSEALDDRHPSQIVSGTDDVRARIIKLALDESALSPRELGRTVHRHRRLFCLRGFGLSAPQGPQS